ncbi:hypothetical protein [Nonomuraea sp. NPDC049758]|uniref:hypothetical protein n=1 Tax=Nonomuraea sp. NPDC049758 TaxID=3154360 RepID=UPI00341BA306
MMLLSAILAQFSAQIALSAAHTKAAAAVPERLTADFEIIDLRCRSCGPVR